MPFHSFSSFRVHSSLLFLFLRGKKKKQPNVRLLAILGKKKFLKPSSLCGSCNFKDFSFFRCYFSWAWSFSIFCKSKERRERRFFQCQNPKFDGSQKQWMKCFRIEKYVWDKSSKLEGWAFANFGNSSGTEGKPSQKRGIKFETFQTISASKGLKSLTIEEFCA